MRLPIDLAKLAEYLWHATDFFAPLGDAGHDAAAGAHAEGAEGARLQASPFKSIGVVV